MFWIVSIFGDRFFFLNIIRTSRGNYPELLFYQELMLVDPIKKRQKFQMILKANKNIGVSLIFSKSSQIDVANREMGQQFLP